MRRAGRTQSGPPGSGLGGPAWRWGSRRRGEGQPCQCPGGVPCQVRLAATCSQGVSWVTAFPSSHTYTASACPHVLIRRKCFGKIFRVFTAVTPKVWVARVCWSRGSFVRCRVGWLSAWAGLRQRGWWAPCCSCHRSVTLPAQRPVGREVLASGVAASLPAVCSGLSVGPNWGPTWQSPRNTSPVPWRRKPAGSVCPSAF